jgi:hypothetical protein
MSEPFVVPQNILEGKGLPFPAGTYISADNTVTQVWNEDKTNLDFVLKLQENKPIEGSEVGKRPMTQRITVIFKNQSVVDVKAFDENTPFALQRSATLLSQLAVALGVATPRSAAEGGGVVFDIENFLAGLASGLYTKQTVGFEVYHRPWKSKKTGNSGTSAEISKFMATGTSAGA